MMGDKVRNENFIAIQGWMVNDLKLKGNELIIYAIIYGFSQTDGQTFNGSLQYLADWTNSTKQGVIKNLKSLVDKGFIEKKEKIVNNIKFCEYYSTKLNGVLNKVEQGIKQSLTPIKQSLTGGIKQSLPNNIDINNIDNNINNNIEDIYSPVEAEQDKLPYKKIIDYLNLKTGSSYKHTTRKTKELIKARFNEGFTANDFKIVIDKKCMEWLNDKNMSKYLRPETLFGTKFESYLNQQYTKGLTTKDLAANMDFSEFR